MDNEQRLEKFNAFVRNIAKEYNLPDIVEDEFYEQFTDHGRDSFSEGYDESTRDHEEDSRYV